MINDQLIKEASGDTRSVMVQEKDEIKVKHYTPIKRGGLWGKRTGIRSRDFISFKNVKITDFGSFRQIIFIV